MELLRPDARFTNMPYGVRIHPDDAFVRGWRYLPGACSVRRHPLFWHLGDYDRRTVDVCLLGGAYPERVKLATELAERGRTAQTGQVDYIDFAGALNRSLTLVAHTNLQAYVMWRVFEAMSTGAIVLIDSDERVAHQMSLLGLSDGTHYMVVEGHDGRPTTDAVDRAVGRLRSDLAFWAAMQTAAFALVRSRHTYTERAKTILQAVGLWREA
jgi:hypothetical protein